MSVLSTWYCLCVWDDCTVDSAGPEGMRCDNSSKSQTSPRVVEQKPFSFWETF